MRGWSSVKLPWKLHSARCSGCGSRHLPGNAFVRKYSTKWRFLRLFVMERVTDVQVQTMPVDIVTVWLEGNRFAPTHTFQVQMESIACSDILVAPKINGECFPKSPTKFTTLWRLTWHENCLLERQAHFTSFHCNTFTFTATLSLQQRLTNESTIV